MKKLVFSLILYAIPSLCSAATGRVFSGTPPNCSIILDELSDLPKGAKHLSSPSFKVYSVTAKDFNQGKQLAKANPSGNFDYFPGNPEFAEANAYYHLNRFTDFMKSLGFKGFSHQVPVAVNFRPNPGEFPLAGATDIGGKPGLFITIQNDINLAFDIAIISHELFHIIQGTITRVLDFHFDKLGANNSSLAIAESTADYFAASYIGNPNIGEYGAKAIQAPYLSTLLNGARHPIHRIGQSHFDGQAISGALWELRSVYGAKIVDLTVFRSLGDIEREYVEVLKPNKEIFRISHFARAVLLNIKNQVGESRSEMAKEILLDRGLLMDSRIAPLSPNRENEVWVNAADPTIGYSSSSIQMKFRVPQNAEDAVLNLSHDGNSSDLSKVKLYLKVDEPILFNEDGSIASFTHEFSAADMIILKSQLLQLRGKEIFMSFLNTDSSELQLTVQLHLK
ncbi:MAG: hypothetical protein IT289_02610 [Oligoflexia bacterium]|nr:hypothetical protein [Oligoflexia bacterium]